MSAARGRGTWRLRAAAYRSRCALMMGETAGLEGGRMGQTGASEVDCSKAPSFAHRCMPPPDLCPQGDFPAAKMIDSVPGVDPARKARLIKALDVDIAWRMHQVPPPHPGSIQG